MFITLLNLVY